MVRQLKHALVDHPEPAWKVAHKIGKSDVWLSKVTRGLIQPKRIDMVNLSKILGKPVNDLFPENKGRAK